MALGFIEKRSFFIVALLITIFSTTQQQCMSTRTIIDGLKFVGAEVAKDLKEDMISPYVNLYYALKDNFSRPIADYTAIAKFYLKFFLTDIKMFNIARFWREARAIKKYNAFLATLSQYQGPHNTLMQAMARRLQLNPSCIQISYQDQYASNLARIIIPTPVAEPEYITQPLGYELIYKYPYSPFCIGHELAHIAHNDNIKISLFACIAPWAIRATLVTANTLTRLAVKAIKGRFQVTPESRPDKIITAAHNVLQVLLRNPVLENMYYDRALTHYTRALEKQADITAAHTFECAEEGAQRYQERANMNVSKCDRLFMEFFDRHPTDEERARYFLEIARQQGYKESASKTIHSADEQPQYYLPLNMKLKMIRDTLLD